MNEAAEASGVKGRIGDPASMRAVRRVNGAQWYTYATFAGNFSPPFPSLRWSFELWYTRAALAPPTIYFALQYRFGPRHWLRYLLIYTYTAPTLVLAALASALQVYVPLHRCIRRSTSSRRRFRRNMLSGLWFPSMGRRLPPSKPWPATWVYWSIAC